MEASVVKIKTNNIKNGDIAYDNIVNYFNAIDDFEKCDEPSKFRI